MTETTLHSTGDSARDPGAPFDPVAGASPGRVRLRQTLTLMRIHARRTLLSRRGVGLYILSLLPVGILALQALALIVVREELSIGALTGRFAAVFNLLILAMVIFFGSAAMFSNAVRREVLERTLHFYFLMPVRREVLILGLYLGGLLATGLVLALVTLVSFVLAYLPAGVGSFTQFLFQGPGLGHLASYVLVAVVAVAGYGAVFLNFGLFFKRPALPVIGFFGWEWLVLFLPPLRKFSISYYLGGLIPVPFTHETFAALVDYPSAGMSVLGLLLAIAVLLAMAGWKARKLEILYGED